ncbi:MAG: TIGR02677 family protein [Lachnospiraceae bacterium]|nr:TIGR02677 family protein [Lachnospiraceae bacterium]
MKVTEKLIKPVTETKYLTVDNADRYRVIVRFLYLQYEKLKYWVYQEEIYENLKEDPYFENYTPEQCQQDLSMLKEWGNLVTMQDTKSVATLEEFKNRKFRYQLSEYAVEIERMVIRLENLLIEGASLEPALLERIRMSLTKIQEIAECSEEQVYSWWNDLNNDFVRLNQNYQDYMRELNSLKAEELMQTKAFLMYKDRLLEYLRTFVKSLQMNVTMIEALLKEYDREKWKIILEKVTEYEMKIPRLEMEITKEQFDENNIGRWKNIEEWFVGENGKSSEASKIFDTTNEVIRRITRYAMRISERGGNSANRREEYYKIAGVFHQCGQTNEAHRLSAVLFGMEMPYHLKGEIHRETDRMNSGVFEEAPAKKILNPRIRSYREKYKKSGIVDRRAEKEKMRLETLEKLEQEKEIINEYINGGRLEFGNLPILEPQIRDVFLIWLSKALENKKRQAKTEDGRIYKVIMPKEEGQCEVRCTDGTFYMPQFVLEFEEI